jgi:hypothetical protein
MSIGHRFRLFFPDGSDAGDLLTTAWLWEPGQTFYSAGHRRFRVLDAAPVPPVAGDCERYRGILVVEPIDGGEHA